MKAIEQHNPAGRLHEILSRAKQELRGNMDAHKLWSAVFEIQLASSPAMPTLREIVSRLLQFDQLIRETERSLRNIEGLPDRYFRPFEKIREIPRRSIAALNSDISERIRSITDTDMVILEFCSERLGEQHAERIIDQKELKSILENVDTLFNEVQASDLDPELKTFVLDGLESIRRGIFEFRIRGPQRLRDTLAEIIGSLAINYDVVQAARNQGDESIGRFEKLFYRLAAVVSFATDGPALLSTVKALLPGG